MFYEGLWAFLAWEWRWQHCLLCYVLELGCGAVICLTRLMTADTAKLQFQQAMCLLGLSSYVTFEHWHSLPQAQSKLLLRELHT